MARTRKVDADTGLAAAMVAFWQHGFQGLGTRQLEAQTGITRFSLQTAYGGKMALFERTLDAYLDQMESNLLPPMNDGSLAQLAKWFEVRCDPAQTPEAGNWGCMMIAAMNEFGDTSAEVSRRADRFEAMLRVSFEQSLNAIDKNNGLSERIDKAAAVEMLVASSIGLNVTIRALGSSNAGCSMATGIAQIIRSWGPSD